MDWNAGDRAEDQVEEASHACCLLRFGHFMGIVVYLRPGYDGASIFLYIPLAPHCVWLLLICVLNTMVSTQAPSPLRLACKSSTDSGS